MVSADNLNLDVLEIIFCHLPFQDLSSAALVSRSFLAGVIPRLYRSIIYTLKHGKKYPRVCIIFSQSSSETQNVLVLPRWHRLLG